jgi:hypothetical protein
MNSLAAKRNAWRFFVALRIGFFALISTGVLLLFLGHDNGIFVVMLGVLFGYASAFRHCTNCGKHIGWVGKLGIGFTTPLLRNCVQCGHHVRKPEA